MTIEGFDEWRRLAALLWHSLLPIADCSHLSFSSRTTALYPRRWKITIPEMKAELELKVELEDQEIITMIAQPSFWEGRVHVSGSIGGKPVQGLGFIERHGFHDHSNLDQFFKDGRAALCSLFSVSADGV